jgi:adenosylmethionine-8-amino-7-oxononanoate aminotransferase
MSTPDALEPRLRHVWHPCAQMQDYEAFPPLEVVSAAGSYLELADGGRLLDAISSWWCKSLGHGHPRLRAALTQQAAAFEHVILANTSNALIRDVAARLAALAPGLDRVFFGGDGSTAVEIAVKLAVWRCTRSSYAGRPGGRS